MNPYFWGFALYALMIAPVRIRLQLAMDSGLRYRVRIAAAGLPVYQKIKSGGENGRKKKKHLLQSALGCKGLMRKILRMFTWRMAEVKIHLSFQDAAATALGFAAAEQALRAAEHFVPFPLAAKVSMDFRARGSSLTFRCIADTRLGNLSAAAVRLWLASAAGRRPYPDAEEDNDAASH